MKEKFDWTIVYGNGEEKTFFGTFEEAIHFAKENAHGWGFQIRFEILIPDEEETEEKEIAD